MTAVDDLRALIFEAAAAHPEIGELAESVKWGQPSFTPKKRNIGSSVRIETVDASTAKLMFICHTGLVERFRDIYPETLAYEGNRAIVYNRDTSWDRDAARHCIAMALTCKSLPSKQEALKRRAPLPIS